MALGELVILDVDLEELESQRQGLSAVLGVLESWAPGQLEKVIPGIEEHLEDLNGIQNMLDHWSDERERGGGEAEVKTRETISRRLATMSPETLTALQEFTELAQTPPEKPVKGHGFEREVWPCGYRKRGSKSLYLWDKLPPTHKTVLTASYGSSLGARRENTGDSNIVASPRACAVADVLSRMRGRDWEDVVWALGFIPSYVDVSRYGWKYECQELPPEREVTC